ncbi:Zinc finger BED domain-containing protein DAYSLEEPER [Bienertia sinuspersici]
MERDYDAEFDPHAPEITPFTGTQNRELETVGSTTPSTPVSGQLEVSKKARTDSSSSERKMRAAEYHPQVLLARQPHRGVDIYLFVVGLIKEWSLERKAFSITCDNAGAMDVMLRLDCPTGWNSTYLMSKRALEAKDALVSYAIVDTSFDSSLTSEQWTIVQFVCRFLGPFHSITELFSGSDYPTANLYFVNVLTIENLLVLGNNHDVDSIKKMASVMLEMFEKYWRDYSSLLAIAAVLDPQYKMARVKEIYDALVEMYKFYDRSPTSFSAQSSHVRNLCEDFEVKSIYDVYAKDVLAIPITSIAAESSFSMGGKVLTKYRLSLRIDNVEAFVTTQNWLFGYLKD